LIYGLICGCCALWLLGCCAVLSLDTRLDEFVAHYDIRNVKDELVRHSSGQHSASMGSDCLVLEYKLDFGELLPPKGEMATLAMIATHDLTPQTWALRVSQGFDWGHCANQLTEVPKELRNLLALAVLRCCVLLCCWLLCAVF
jgi:hypothetical protein